MKLLVTAGPTREPIDPVRYISNRSSGKMGFSIAAAAIEKGFEVCLISGPVNLSTPTGVERIDVETARQMYTAVEREISGCEAAVFCAAVSDYRVREVAEEKIKKSEDSLQLDLEKTEDILGSCRSRFGFKGILIGFAAETENLRENAQGKLEKKGCDFLIANDVSRSDIGFDSDQNEVIIFSEKEPPRALPIQDKVAIGRAIIELIEVAINS